MPKFEYKVAVGDTEKLNEYGEDGWEVISVLTTTPGALKVLLKKTTSDVVVQLSDNTGTTDPIQVGKG